MRDESTYHDAIVEALEAAKRKAQEEAWQAEKRRLLKALEEELKRHEPRRWYTPIVGFFSRAR